MMQKQVNNEQREELFAGIEQEVEGAEADLTTPSGSTGGVGGTAVSVPLRVSVPHRDSTVARVAVTVTVTVAESGYVIK